jgi:predicted DNA-binding ribbon-helix-helix protein
MKKRSVRIAGHATSLSLEDEFWAELQAIASAREQSFAALLEEVDAGRKPGENLSSALRLFVLRWLKRSA